MLTLELLKLAAVGGQWIMWLLVVVSVLSLGVIFDRWLFFRRRRVDVEALGAEVIGHLQRGDREAAARVLAAHRSVEAAVVGRCLEWLDDGPDAVAEVLAAQLRVRRPGLEQGTVFLGTVGNNAPFVGLLGTVLGVVQAFQELGRNTAGAMGTVMSGIAEALIATAVGILVAIPAVIAFNVFTRRAQIVEERAQALMSLLLAHQKSTRQSRRLAVA